MWRSARSPSRGPANEPRRGLTWPSSLRIRPRRGRDTTHGSGGEESGVGEWGSGREVAAPAGNSSKIWTRRGAGSYGLLATRLANHLLTTPHLPPELLPAAPLPLPVRLHVLRHPALPPTSKLSFFLAATPPSCPLLGATFPVLVRALATHSPPLLDALLPFALSSSCPSELLPALLSALLSASRVDTALALLDAAPPELLSRLAAAALPSLIASPDPISAVPAVRRLLPIASHPPPVRSTNRLLLALSKENLYDDFRHVFDEMSRRGLPSNIRFYNICIHAFGKWRRLDMSLKLFAAMKTASPPLVPDICTYNSLIRALVVGARVADGLVVFDEMKLAGIEPDVFTYQAIVDGCCKSFRMDDALRLFQEMRGSSGVKGDVVVYNSLLDGLFKAKKLDEACGFFETMVADGFAVCWKQLEAMVKA
ncbi:hypothetical protein E2562_001457 [Oryza meyeriana var. granulata]|uniref:Pentacotripeptide-repeat region of PRORP domain-containing protein n=1 Tax=Oryza meyeriana var. granulata TaxID=110450 RepID=A0A6G1DCZ0_9ORYZ|nr:hypothetical protein E2562_001457 [Oryza meyeriana var. granulata]